MKTLSQVRSCDEGSWGWSLAVLAVLVLVSHLVEHLGFFSFASPGVEDLVAGYPMAFLLGIVAVVILSKHRRVASRPARSVLGRRRSTK